VPANTTRLAYAPHGRALAIGSAGLLWITGVGRVPIGSVDSIDGLAWNGDEIAVALGGSSARGVVQMLRPAKNGATTQGQPIALPGRITALDAGGGRLVLALRRNGLQTRLVTSSRQVLLDVGSGAVIGELAVR
jgi:hypothetical protein